MQHRIVLTDEQKRRLDAAMLDGIGQGLGSNIELAEHLRGSIAGEVPDRPALEWTTYVRTAVKRLRADRKIEPKYRTPRGAARGGWRLA